MSNIVESVKSTHVVIKELLDKWRPLLGLDSWRDIGLEFVYVAPPEDEPVFYQWVMQAHTNWPHMQALIEVNMTMCKDYTPEELEYSIVHELCHVMVAEIEGKAKREERVVHQMATAFLRVEAHHDNRQ